MSTFLEIERKFLVDWDEFPKENVKSVDHIRQGYISDKDGITVRVRTSMLKGSFMTVKGPTTGFSRFEAEFPIPNEDGMMLLENICEASIVKQRFEVEFGEDIWEVDYFEGDNAGLIVAEIELGSEDSFFSEPPWVTEEVTDDPRYYNSNLIKHPYKEWKDE